MKCENCKKEITAADYAGYSQETNAYVCSLDCMTNYAHEYLRMRPVLIEELSSCNADYASTSEERK